MKQINLLKLKSYLITFQYQLKALSLNSSQPYITLNKLYSPTILTFKISFQILIVTSREKAVWPAASQATGIPSLQNDTLDSHCSLACQLNMLHRCISDMFMQQSSQIAINNIGCIEGKRKKNKEKTTTKHPLSCFHFSLFCKTVPASFLVIAAQPLPKEVIS